MLQIKECQDIISTVKPIENVEEISLLDSMGRVLAQDIYADIDLPPFNKSAMDGYACRSQDLPGPLKVSGQIAAGSMITVPLLSGHCYRIFTGAPLPQGADCVIMQEHTVKNLEDNVVFTEKETKKNICYKGEDLKKGQIAIKTQTIVEPQHIAVMAGFGVTTLKVYTKPKVAIICSGSELVEPDEKPDNAMIRNSNAYQLMAQVKKAGADVTYLGIVPDDMNLLKDKILEATDNHDAVIVTGGASIGNYDFMPTIMSSIGATVFFSSINIQPGKPIIFASYKGSYVLGLSGNPVSSFLQFHLIAQPVLHRLTNADSYIPKKVISRLAKPINRKKSDRQLYVPIALTLDGLVQPVEFNGSAHITALNNIDGFAILEPDIKEVAANQSIETLLI